MSDHGIDGKVERPAFSPAWELGQSIQKIPATGKPPARPLESITRSEDREPQPDGTLAMQASRSGDRT